MRRRNFITKLMEIKHLSSVGSHKHINKLCFINTTKMLSYEVKPILRSDEEKELFDVSYFGRKISEYFNYFSCDRTVNSRNTKDCEPI